MNVTFSNTITDTVRKFRETIYCTEEFKKIFTNNLEQDKYISANNIMYIPDQFGGWSINVTTKECIDHFETYATLLMIIADIFATSVHNVNKSISCKHIAANLINVIVTGRDSFIIKL